MQIFFVMKASNWCTKIQGPILVVTQPGFANQLHKEADLSLYTDVYASVCAFLDVNINELLCEC